MQNKLKLTKKIDFEDEVSIVYEDSLNEYKTTYVSRL